MNLIHGSGLSRKKIILQRQNKYDELTDILNHGQRNETSQLLNE